MNVDLVSTIIPVHNRPKLLQEAVSSVLAQTYRPIEVIIVDDGSTDETSTVADHLQATHVGIIQVIHKQNEGPGASREAGRLVAQGRFIQYLDSDDLLLPRKFELQVAALRNRPECGVAYGRTAHENLLSDVGDPSWRRTDQELPQMFPAFAALSWWGTGTPLYRREVTDQAGPWLPLINCEDWEYDCRIAAVGTRLAYVPEEVWVERHHDWARLSAGGTVDPVKLKHRSIAHTHIARHIQRAGLLEMQVDVQYFGYLTFLLARQCGAAGLVKESSLMMALVREMFPRTIARTVKYRGYALAGCCVGWQRVGQWSAWRDQHGV